MESLTVTPLIGPVELDARPPGRDLCVQEGRSKWLTQRLWLRGHSRGPNVVSNHSAY